MGSADMDDSAASTEVPQSLRSKALRLRVSSDWEN